MMKPILTRLLVLSLACVLAGGNATVGNLRASVRMAPSTTAPLPDEEEHRAKSVEEQAASTSRHIRLRTTSPPPIVRAALVQSAQPQRSRPFTPPDTQADLRNGIGAPLRC